MEGGDGGGGWEKGWGWMGAKVSVCRSETMFNITWHLCQTVSPPPLHTHRPSGFLYLRDLPLCCLPAQTLRLAFCKPDDMNEIWPVTFFFFNVVAWEALEGHVLPSLAGQACLHPPPGLLWAVWGLRDWLEASGEGAVLCFIPMTLKVSLGSAAQGWVIFWNLKGDEWNLGSQMHSKRPQTAVIMAVCCPALVSGGTGECGLIAYHSPCEPDFTSGFNLHPSPVDVWPYHWPLSKQGCSWWHLGWDGAVTHLSVSRVSGSLQGCSIIQGNLGGYPNCLPPSPFRPERGLKTREKEKASPEIAVSQWNFIWTFWKRERSPNEHRSAKAGGLWRHKDLVQIPSVSWSCPFSEILLSSSWKWG